MLGSTCPKIDFNNTGQRLTFCNYVIVSKFFAHIVGLTTGLAIGLAITDPAVMKKPPGILISGDKAAETPAKGPK